MKPIYLDFNASTPLDPAVRAEMQTWLDHGFGNPSSAHWAGRPAREAVETARERVAALLGSKPSEVIFTGGGSEANNHALKGTYFRARQEGIEHPHFVTSAVEHPAVLEPLRFLESLGAVVTILPVDRHGLVDPEAVKRALRPSTVLITIMHANNEVGTIEPIVEIAAVARGRGVPLHTDAAQTVGKIPTDVEDLGVDLLSVAAHKFYGPKGVGALFLRNGIELVPWLHGAGHEGKRRAGTENVVSIAGLGRACDLAPAHLGMPEIQVLRDRFEEELVRRFGGKISINGHPRLRLPNTSSVNFHGRAGAEVLAALGDVAASTGSACHSGSITLSPVLAAMGVPPDRGMGAVRFSLGRSTSQEEIEEVLRRLEAAIA